MSRLLDCGLSYITGVLPEVDGGEGPILPRDDWAESEILEGSNGWVQVSSNCLVRAHAHSHPIVAIIPVSGTGDTFERTAIEETKASPAYSKPFRIVLPSTQPPSSGIETYYVTPPPSSPEVPSTPRSILPHIPTLFPPPPFTPSHPVFVHLSALATAESEKLRAEAEEQLRKVVEEKVAQLKQAEAKLKQDVESIWSTFKVGVERIESASAKGRPPAQDGPVVNTATLQSMGFPRLPWDSRNGSTSQDEARPSVIFALIYHTRWACRSTERRKFARRTDETWTSRWTLHQLQPSSPKIVPPHGRSPRAGKSAIKKPKPEVDTSGAATTSAKDSPKPEEGDNKRKVTFDVKPDVTIIASEKPKTNGGKRPKTEEAVFDMDNESPEDEVDVPIEASPAPSQPETPIAEPTRAPRRGSSRRHASWSGLPSSFSALRPASLPLPSIVRPPPRHTASDDRSTRPQGTTTPTSRETVFSPVSADAEVKRRAIDIDGEPREFREAEEEVTDPHEAEILKLVAASTPSHRSAWKKDSSAWRTFVARQKSQKQQQLSSDIQEEDESSATDGPAYYDESGDEDSAQEEESATNGFWSNDTSVARSLPIPIGPLGGDRKPVNAASYQPKAAAEASDKVSSAAMRRASYAERDRRDRWTLELSKPEAEVGPRSLQRALKILQKRSEIPGDGMWRSLA
ncbi:hypothetical protein BC629DRAFT_1723522 [Irpex lacteus]|nr:hypothetical protein BC629DRAFT_1723522 [Irpex lacteus]